MTSHKLAITHVKQVLTMAGPNRPRVGGEMDNPGVKTEPW